MAKLDADERTRLNDLISKGKAAAKSILKARILLKTDLGEGGEGWSDEKIAKALDTNVTPRALGASACGPSSSRKGSTRRSPARSARRRRLRRSSTARSKPN